MKRAAVLLAAVGLVAVTSIPQAARQMPVEERRISVEFTTPPPASLDELLASATVVVEATIARSYPYDAQVARGFMSASYIALPPDQK